MIMRFQASQFPTSTSLHHVSKIVTKCIKIVSTDVRNYKIFSGEIPRTPLTRGGNAPSRALPLLVPSALVNVFDLSWPDHFSKADDGPARPSSAVRPVRPWPDHFFGRKWFRPDHNFRLFASIYPHRLTTDLICGNFPEILIAPPEFKSRTEQFHLPGLV